MKKQSKKESKLTRILLSLNLAVIGLALSLHYAGITNELHQASLRASVIDHAGQKPNKKTKLSAQSKKKSSSSKSSVHDVVQTPQCTGIGTRSEGWMFGGKRIRYDNCGSCPVPRCRSDLTPPGWYSCDTRNHSATPLLVVGARCQ